MLLEKNSVTTEYILKLIRHIRIFVFMSTAVVLKTVDLGRRT